MQIICIKQEINSLYPKKMNKELYETRLQIANNWENIPDNIETNTNEKLNKEIHNVNCKLQKNLAALKETQQQNYEYKEHHKFYTRVKNPSTTKFTEDEYKLLIKGLQYNLHFKKKK
jgi:hypothetical protein